MKIQRTLIAATVLSTITLTACAGGYGSGYGSSNDSYGQKSSYGSSKTSYSSDKNSTKPASTGVVAKTQTSIGEVFSNSKGLTLYTFKKDGTASSSCYQACAVKWPPFVAKADAKTWGAFTIIERNDGTHQWAYKDQPLYTWIGDEKKGDIKGHGIGNVWYAATTH